MAADCVDVLEEKTQHEPIDRSPDRATPPPVRLGWL
jgi:hypothetical protein